jgi:hypothetical protein
VEVCAEIVGILVRDRTVETEESLWKLKRESEAK